MTSAGSPRAGIEAIFGRFSGLSAGYRLIILLSLALLPLGLLAVIASLQMSRSADFERQATARITAAESARRLGAELSVDASALRTAVNLLERGGNEAAICARTLGVLATSFNAPMQFGIVTRAGRPVCGSAELAAAKPGADLTQDFGASLSPRGLLVTLPSDERAFVGIAFYPRAQLAAILQPTGLTAPHTLTLAHGDEAIWLIERFKPSRFDRRETITMAVPDAPLSLVLAVRSAPFTAAEILTILLPLIMWLVASLVAWIVFNRLVIAPLGQLRTNIAAYRPGEILQPLRRMTIPAREIEELGDTFQTISRTVATHEEELARGLARQTRLTREVHHRVKNNLQVVSSLISLHARAAQTDEASAAYATISRRVDALAVVHRNHFAELEENRGVNLRSLIGELSANLRATAPGDANRLSILIDVPAVQVGQDTAIPIAFLTTELVELAMTVDPAAVIRVSVVWPHEDDRACLVIASPALRQGDQVADLLSDRYGRVLEGLSRQLRSALGRDGPAGSYTVCFPIVTETTDDSKK